MVVESGLAACCAIIVIINLASFALAARVCHRRPRTMPPPTNGPPVSIVRPLCGVETYSEELLLATFRLDYPSYEILFCVQRPDDPVIALTQRLIEENPQVEAKLLLGDEPFSPNPKLNNCVKGWEAARREWIILTDSNILTPPDYVQTLFARFGAGIGVVFSPPIGTRAENFGAELECAFLNTYQARWLYVADSLGLDVIQGKSMLFRRADIERGGGVRTLAAEVAEDAAARRILLAAGLRTEAVDWPFEQPLGARPLTDVIGRQKRWTRLRRLAFPAYYPAEIIAGGLVPIALALLGSPAVAADRSIAALLVAALLYGAESLFAWRNGWFLSWRSPLAFALRDLLLPALWISAYISHVYVWQNTTVAARNPLDAKAL